MATPGCIKNIRDNGTGLGPCTDKFCESISFALGLHCTKHTPPLHPDDPVGPQLDPNLNGPGRPGYCYCCCSCFGADTPIEVSPGEYALAADLTAAQTVMAAGADLRWEPRTVESASTWDSPEGRVGSMYYLRYTWDGDAGDTGEDWREVIVSPDHPFLMEDGTLVAIQDLTKKELRLRRADGQLAEVLVVARGSLVGGVTSIQMEGPFDGRDLTGHLLNTNGLVSGDYKVQVHYSSLHLAAELTHDFGDLETIPVGTAEYQAVRPSPAYAAFLEDPSQWPRGFVPAQRREINVPATASRYLTDRQARDIEHNAPTRGAGNTFPANSLLYLFNLARGLYPSVDFLLDWDNPVPNAYTWSSWGRQTVVVTGGMVQLQEMQREGLSLVLGAMLAYRSPEVRCVGEADYASVADVAHDLWEGNLYIAVVDKGLPQIKALFSYIDPRHAQPDPDDPCQRPGIGCRIACYERALSLFDVPDCARPRPSSFGLQDARSISPTGVALTFDRALDVPTAETVDNYAFEPAVDVVAARVAPITNVVVIETSELAPATTYVVHVSGVVSNDDVPLDPRHSTGAFTTRATPDP